MDSKPSVAISLVIPLVDRSNELYKVIDGYVETLREIGDSYEVIIVGDGVDEESHTYISKLLEREQNFVYLRLSQSFGDSTALAVGLEQACGEKIIVLPGYPQIEPTAIPSMLRSLSHADVVAGYRNRARDSLINRLQGRIFSRLASLGSHLEIGDLGCEAKAIRREVLSDLTLYGEQHRFFPLVANQLGFSVTTVELEQSERDLAPRLRHPTIYVRRLLDVLTTIFLLRFTKKPLRFFGLVGLALMAIGTLIMGWVSAERLFLGVELANRPTLFFGALSFMVGLQVLAVGLIGEIVIFTHAKDLKDYQVREIVGLERSGESAPVRDTSGADVTTLAN